MFDSRIHRQGKLAQAVKGRPHWISSELEDLCGVTNRQLQWWDETKIFLPSVKLARLRVYFLEAAYEVLVAVELRNKHVRLSALKQVMRAVRRKEWPDQGYLVILDGFVMIKYNPSDVITLLSESSSGGAFLVDLGSVYAKLAPKLPGNSNGAASRK